MEWFFNVKPPKQIMGKLTYILIICLIVIFFSLVSAERAEYQEILEQSEKLLKNNPDDYYALYNKAVCLSGLEKYEDAVVTFERLIGIKDDVDVIWNDFGEALWKLERYYQALEAYEKAILLDSGNEVHISNAWLGKGKVLIDMELNDEALKAFEKAIELNPFNAEAYDSKQKIYEKLKQFDNAQQIYEKKLKMLKEIPAPTGYTN
jgi:tetratricopeptide (TPR) repeat protein